MSDPFYDVFADEDLGLTDHASLSEEKFAQQAFTRNYTIYSKGQAGKRLFSESDPRFQLPNNTTLHTLSHFLDPQDDHSLTPLNLPLLQHESYQTFYNFVSTIPDALAAPFPVGDTVIFQKSKAAQEGLAFFRTHRSVRRMVSEATLTRRSNVLIVNDYSLLHRAKLQGSFQAWRKTDMILRSMLENIVKTSANRNHFLYFPVSSIRYSRAQYQRTFPRNDVSSTAGITDPSFYIASQLLGFIYGQEHDLDVVPPKTDAQMMALRDSQLEKGHSSALPDLTEMPTVSLFNRLTDKQLATINIVLTHSGRMMIYNLGQLKQFAKTANFYNRFYQHLQLLSQVEDHDGEDSDSPVVDLKTVIDGTAPVTPDEADDHDQQVDAQRVKDTGDDLPSPEIAPELAPTSKAQHPIDLPPVEEDEPERVVPDTDIEKVIAPVSVDDKLSKQTYEVLPFAQNFHGELGAYIDTLDKTERERALKLLERQRSIVLNGKTLEDHALSSGSPLPKEEAFVNKETHPDASVCQTVVPTFDKHYLKEYLHRDIARTLLAFSKFGFFVHKIEETTLSDRMNVSERYRVELVHADGSRHVIPFTIPKFDEDGNLLANGVTYRMSKQMLANPVCKVSPSRVNLSSTYNKSIVERIQTQRGSFAPYLLKTIDNLLRQKLLLAQFGRSRPDETIVPYEYSIIAGRYDSLSIPDDKGYRFLFDYTNRFDGLTAPQTSYLVSQEPKYGVFCGYAPNGNLLFWDMDDRIHALTTSGKHVVSTPHFLSLLMGLYPSEVERAVPYEYTMIKIMDQVYPTVFVLGFVKGLQWLIDRYKLDYRWVPTGQRLSMSPTDLRIRFRDGSMIFSRYPLEASLIFAGLSWCNTPAYTKAEFDKPEVYYSILEGKLISTNRLKGVSSFIDLFVDPITEEVLQDYGEPTNTIDLIILCSSLLTYQSHYQASSVHHHRIRGYERIPAILYNEMARALAGWRTAKGRVRQLSINPEAVYQRIIGDQTCEVLETLNPAQEFRTLARVSYAGLGGRTSRSFVVEDRRYPKDGVGVISENTPDSGKVGMIFSLSLNPNVVSVRGKLIPYSGNDPKTGGQMLSLGANLFSGTMQDDQLGPVIG